MTVGENPRMTYRRHIEKRIRPGNVRASSLINMTLHEPVDVAAPRHALSPTSRPALGVTIYGCAPDENDLFQELAPRFGVRPTIIGAAISEDNTGLLAGNRHVSVGHKTPVSNSTLGALARAGVEYLSTRSAGCDHIDVEHARELGITVGTVSYSPDSVADYTVMMMLMVLRDTKAMLRRVDGHDYRLSGVRGRELRDMTVGVIGPGRIGRAVMDRLRGFGCGVLIHGTGAGTGVSLDTLLANSDIVTLHTPLTAETRHLLDRRSIARMKPGACVINTGRGGLIDTEALVEALEAGRLGGVALDVVEGEKGIFYADRRDEPIVDNDPLLRLHRHPAAIISPHTAYYTDRALRDVVENSLINCVNFARGKRHG